MKETSGTIGLPMAVIVGLNAVIGAGIFSVPAQLQMLAGPAGLAVYLVVIGLVLCIALSFARMAMLYPMSSTFYSYPKLWLGHRGGMLTTGLYLFGLITALGLLARLAGTYTAPYFFSGTISPTIWALVYVGILLLVNLAGATMTVAGHIVLFVLTLIPLVLITFMCGVKGHVANLTPFAPFGFWGAFQAVPVVAFGFFGFEAIPSLFSSIRNPQENIPRALAITLLLTGFLYFAFTAAVMLAVPAALFTSKTEPLSAVLRLLYPRANWLGWLIDGAIVATILGTVHAMLWSVSTLVVDTAKNIFGQRRYAVKPVLLCIAGATALVTSVISNIDLLFSFVSVGIAGAYALSLVPLLTLGYKRTLGHIVLALAGISGALLLCGCGIHGIFKFW